MLRIRIHYSEVWIRILLVSSTNNSKKNLDSYCFVTSFWLFIFDEWCKCTSVFRIRMFFGLGKKRMRTEILKAVIWSVYLFQCFLGFGLDPDSVAILSDLFTSVFRIRIGSGFCSELNCVCQCFGSGLNWVCGSVSGIPQAGQTRPQKQPKKWRYFMFELWRALRKLFLKPASPFYGFRRNIQHSSIDFLKLNFVLLQIFVSKNLHLNPDRIRRLQSLDPN